MFRPKHITRPIVRAVKNQLRARNVHVTNAVIKEVLLAFITVMVEELYTVGEFAIPSCFIMRIRRVKGGFNQVSGITGEVFNMPDYIRVKLTLRLLLKAYLKTPPEDHDEQHTWKRRAYLSQKAYNARKHAHAGTPSAPDAPGNV